MTSEESYSSWISGYITGFIKYIKTVPGFDLNPTYYKSKKFDDNSSNV